jgi:hypothetical protein
VGELRQPNELDMCPHSDATYHHRWHGLPVKGCGGSHLAEDDARRLAKLFDPNDEKYPEKNLNTGYFSAWIELIRDSFR